MGAPHKKGLDYFPHDCNHNHKIEIVEARFGLIGYGVYFKLLEYIYSQGEELNVNEDFWLIFFVKKCQIDYQQGIEIVNYLVQKGLFDKEKFEQGILTSNGIKTRFAEATKRRKKALSLPNTAQREVNDDINSINVNINSINADINSQRKVKESKVNKSKVKESKVKESEEKTDFSDFQKKIENQEDAQPSQKILLKNFTPESLEYHLLSRDTTKPAFELWRRNFPKTYKTAIQNFIAWQSLQAIEYHSLEALMQHLGRYTNDRETQTKQGRGKPKNL